MKNMMQKIRNQKGFTLVELMIVVAIIGILAAIAIPAFLRSVKKSKTSEAEGTMRKMADGSKAYFTSEQRGVGAATQTGEPWHSAVNEGFPVTWSNYVFPGGATYGGFSSGLTGGIGLGTCTDAPAGGAKEIPYDGASANRPPAGSLEAAVVNKFGIDFADPMYFIYNYITTGQGEAATATITALSNFDAGTPECHTITQRIQIGDGTATGGQEVVILPSITSFEFE